MTIRISVTEAARNFADILNRVKYQNEDFILERGGRSVALISPHHEGVTAAELAAKWKGRARLDAGDAEAFGRDIKAARKEQGLPRDPWKTSRT